MHTKKREHIMFSYRLWFMVVDTETIFLGYRYKGVHVADVVVAPGKTITFRVSNFEPVQLEDGETLGQLEPATVVDANLETSKDDAGEC